MPDPDFWFEPDVKEIDFSKAKVWGQKTMKNKMYFYFKKTMSGMILMVRESENVPDGVYGEYKYVWKRATEEDASNFTKEITELIIYKDMIKDIKKNNPEVLI
jgi:hypothetical protein